MTVITLTTDFGDHNEYTGVVKGVILNINPAATLVDITHHIAPQDVSQAAYTLASAFPYFPPDSIHLVVVDPGVGSQRDIVGVRTGDYCFVAPNNGVLTAALQMQQAEEIVKISNKQYFLAPVSHTFHGRDIFAPAAAHISRGIPLTALGPAMHAKDLVRLNLPVAGFNHEGELEGRVVDIDRFGNIITNITIQLVDAWRRSHRENRLVVEIGGHRIDGLADHYAKVSGGATLAVIGSRNCLEVAVRNGDAAGTLDIRKGDTVRVGLPPDSVLTA